MSDITSRAFAPVRFSSDQIMIELAQHLVDEGMAAREQIEDLRERARLTGTNLDRLLIRESVVDEETVLRTLSQLANIEFQSLAGFDIDRGAVSRLPARAAFRYQVMPLTFREGALVLAINRVPDLAMVDSLSLLAGCALDWALCTQSDLTKSLKHFYGLGVEAVDEIIQAKTDEAIEIEETDVSVETADPGVAKFVNQLIFEAISMDATDIHLEPFETRLSLRYRVDGVLQDIPVPQGVQKLKRAISSCIKIMAQLNIAERRKPHDGRIKVRVGKEEFDLRVSVLPTRFGETVNMRILNRKAMFIDLEHLGLADSQLRMFNSLSALPHGIILITGPTGSGKTTSLYALLARMNSREVKIITVEDPIEYQLEGISQIQVHSQIGLTFANILRSILRHDPDIILIGEIRDSETADIAVRAALTGHLVFSTLHTNDAASAVTRLIDMGVEPYLVSSCLEGVVAQRLVRRVCDSCREETRPEDYLLEEITHYFPDRVAGATFYKAHGCPNCNFTGYKGRIALFEIMIIDDDIRGLIVHQRPSNEICQLAIEKKGLVTLRENGLSRVLTGITTIDEVVRVARKIDLGTASRSA